MADAYVRFNESQISDLFGLQSLVLDDDNENPLSSPLDQSMADIETLLPIGEAVSATSVSEAINYVASQYFDVSVLDLNMQYDTSIPWEKVGNEYPERNSGGFYVYFALREHFSVHQNKHEGLLLPTIVVLYTNNVKLQTAMGPFWSDFSPNLIKGRPFRIVLKRDRALVGLESALLEQERARYTQYSNLFYSPEGIVNQIDTMGRYAKPEDWLSIGNEEVGPNLKLAKAFPISWNRIWAEWDNLDGRAQRIERLKELLLERNYLRSLNLLFKAGNNLEVVTHVSQANTAAAFWDGVEEDVKVLPEETQKNLMTDLGCKSWDVPPWGDDYNNWQGETASRFKNQWRKWAVDEEDVGNVKSFAETVPGVALQNLYGTRTVDAESSWKGSHVIGDRNHRELYMDPHIIAKAAEYEVQEINKHSSENGFAYFRVVTDVIGRSISFDIIGSGNGGFAEELPSILENGKFTRRNTVALQILKGWAEVWFYTHESGNGNILGVNLSRPCRNEDDWPDKSMGDIDWNQVDSVLRIKFPLD